MRINIPLIIALALPLTCHAADEPSLGELMSGFEEPPASLDAVIDGFDSGETTELEGVMEGFDDAASSPGVEQTVRPPSALSIDGDLSLSAASNTAHQAPNPGQTDWRGLSRLRSKVNLALEYKLDADWKLYLGGRLLYDAAYAINGRDNYLASLVESSESETELHEAYLQGSLGNSLDVKLGRQIVVWGKSDNLRLTDVVNPMDMREMGMVDIEDLRLPSAMARFDYYRGDWSLSALAIPEIRLNKEPAFGSDFYPKPVPLPADIRPASGSDNTEYALALNGIFSGWDLALYRAWVYDDQSHLVVTPGGAQRLHARIQMSGVAANWVIGSWLLKGEAAQFDGVAVTDVPTHQRHDNLLLGVEYAGIQETTLSLETLVRRWSNYSSSLSLAGVERDSYQSALRASRKLLHDRLTLTLVRLAFGPSFNQGGFSRLSAEYDLADGVNISGGYIDYQQGSTIPFTAIGDNDRLFAEIRYSF